MGLRRAETMYDLQYMHLSQVILKLSRSSCDLWSGFFEGFKAECVAGGDVSKHKSILPRKKSYIIKTWIYLKFIYNQWKKKRDNKCIMFDRQTQSGAEKYYLLQCWRGPYDPYQTDL